SEYRVIEVNPRVSRSSALASKATGYPIAKIAAKVGLGLHLDEIRNPVTGTTVALFEPSIDYVVVKIPRWPFDKFAGADRRLGTQMKATGEVMAIDRTFEAALHKAIRSLEIGLDSLEWSPARSWSDEELLEAIRHGDDRRLFLLAECLRRGHTVDELAAATSIDAFFLLKLQRIVEAEEALRGGRPLDAATLRAAKRLGLTDARIGALTGHSAAEIRRLRLEAGVRATYKMVDTCAAEFEAVTPYYYSTYEDENEVQKDERPTVIVLGSGPIRIGQGIEFDYCSVHAVRTLREAGYDAVIINNNPETVSTDFDTADRLYFEPLTLEDVLNVVDLERPIGVIPQFGGQTAINLAQPLADAGVPILGTDVDAIDAAETRERFDRLLDRLGIARPGGAAATSVEEARAVAARVGYPVMVRPSYVLGGRAMEVAHDPDELDAYLAGAVEVAQDRPIWIDHYIEGIELEVDAVSDGETVVIPGIMQHVERAGVHSGDSIAIFPAKNLPDEVVREVEAVTVRIARALNVRGILNLQLVYDHKKLYVLEVNPRSSRTVPFLTKATGVPLIPLATRAAMGQRLADLGYASGRLPEPPHVAVKLPVFSWNKLPGVDAALGPEMKSTGEVMAVDDTLTGALERGLLAAGMRLPAAGEGVLLTVSDRDKPAAVELARRLKRLGYVLYATAGTQAALAAAGIEAIAVRKVTQDSPNLLDALRAGKIRLVINGITRGRQPTRDGFRIRRAAVERGIPCLTSLDTAAAVVEVLEELARRPAAELPRVRALQDLATTASGAGRA
ncbi:MAG TPA: carbamoyl-phosphate synthase large subunit, partial [Bacillota bacterium]